MKEEIRRIIEESIVVRKDVLNDADLLDRIGDIVRRCVEVYRNDGKILFCGNGGSAADAQHISAELTGRFLKDRPALYAEALHVNTSALTAIANDYGYDYIFARQVEAMGRRGDILFGLSTSGNSPNIIRAMEVARDKGMLTFGFTGANAGRLEAVSDVLVKVPSRDTARIQEVHLLLGHIICGAIEKELYPG